MDNNSSLPTKQNVILWEEKNLNHIFILNSHGFWRSYQNSALYFKSFIWSNIKINQKYDPLSQKELLSIGFPESNLADVIEAAKKNKILLTVQKNNFLTFDLPKSQPPNQLQSWIKNQNQNFKIAQQLSKPFYADQATYKALFDLFMISQEIAKNLPKDLKPIWGVSLINKATQINQIYEKVVSSKNSSTSSKLENLENIESLIKDQILIFRLALETNNVTPQKVIKFSRQANDALTKIHFWKNTLTPKKKDSIISLYAGY